ncbi:MAG: hypothetical protein AB8B60_02890 [Sulfitobacter sp.]
MAQPTFRETASYLPLGIMVVALYIVFGLAVFGGFATYIYRGEWIETVDQSKALQPDVEQSERLEIDNLIFIIKRKETLTREIKDMRNEILALDREISGVKADYNRLIGQTARLAEQAVSSTREQVKTLSRIGGMDSSAPLARLEAVQLSEALNHQKITRAVELVEGLVAPFDLNQMSKDRFTAAKSAYRAKATVFQEEMVTHTNAAHAERAKESGLEALREKMASDLTTSEETLAKLQGTVGLSSAHQARFESLVVHLPLGYKTHVLQRLVSFPTIFLTLIVTIAAGGLGTVVAFSRRYYHEHSPGLTMSRLFVNVGEGIAAAIAIFLFSGAGMLALTQGGGGPGNVELSPYTVAFVAFLSGFMAEDAFASIQAAGKRIFSGGSSDDPPPSTEVSTEGKPMPVLEANGSITIKP